MIDVLTLKFLESIHMYEKISETINRIKFLHENYIESLNSSNNSLDRQLIFSNISFIWFNLEH